MTNREVLINSLSKRDYEVDKCVTGLIECPYTDCTNPYEYGTADFQIYCDEVCKTEWLESEEE